MFRLNGFKSLLMAVEVERLDLDLYRYASRSAVPPAGTGQGVCPIDAL
jgi:hypothetical protein